MIKNYVTDTNSIISYFNDVFSVPQILSARARSIIHLAIDIHSSDVRLSIPSVVFLEIYDKYFVDEEIARKIRYEVFEPIKNSPNIEIKPLEQEVLENLLKISDELKSHEIHDKIVLASAMMLNCALITTDGSLIGYIKKHRVISFIN